MLCATAALLVLDVNIRNTTTTSPQAQTVDYKCLYKCCAIGFCIQVSNHMRDRSFLEVMVQITNLGHAVAKDHHTTEMCVAAYDEVGESINVQGAVFSCCFWSTLT